MKLPLKTAGILLLFSFTTGPAIAQSSPSHSTTMQHSQHSQHSEGAEMLVVNEPGQGAFASIAEIVKILRNDPGTNWKHVDINGLRMHLIDMDALITETNVVQSNTDNGVKMTISLAGRGGEAASRMVPAHGPVLSGETGWHSDFEVGETSLIWIVSSDADAQVIQALGFYGLMAVGDHHAPHHLGLAQGKMVH